MIIKVDFSILKALPDAGWIVLGVIVLAAIFAVLDRLRTGHWPSAKSLAELLAMLIHGAKRQDPGADAPAEKELEPNKDDEREPNKECPEHGVETNPNEDVETHANEEHHELKKKHQQPRRSTASSKADKTADRANRKA